MDKLILYPTDTSQWHALVSEACVRGSRHLREDVESYLVFMLMRFSQNPQLSSTVIALDYLESYQCIGQHRANSLRDVGDKCLLLSGLFPGVAERRRVAVSYYIEMGKSAYYTLSSAGEVALADLFGNLCQEFDPMVDVLHAMRVYKHITE